MLASSLLPIFSEACWQGADVDAQEIILAGECLTGVPRAVLEAMGEFYPSDADIRTGKSLVWCDPLYPIHDPMGDPLDAAIARSEKALAALAAYREELPCAYACLLFEIVKEKARILHDLREKYLGNDRVWLTKLAQEDLPALTNQYAKLMGIHRRLWERDYKRNGWEVVCLRYGGAMARLADVTDELVRYLAGELKEIVELEETPLSPARIAQHYEHMVTPSAALGTGF